MTLRCPFYHNEVPLTDCTEDMESETKLRPVRSRCLYGGIAPCIDDLCHGSDTTVCGLERYEDFCEHGFIPETCPECAEGMDEFYD